MKRNRRIQKLIQWENNTAENDSVFHKMEMKNMPPVGLDQFYSHFWLMRSVRVLLISFAISRYMHRRQRVVNEAKQQQSGKLTNDPTRFFFSYCCAIHSQRYYHSANDPLTKDLN